MKWHWLTSRIWSSEDASSRPDPPRTSPPGTGGATSLSSVVDQDKCIDCYTCWIYCPDNSIVFRDDKMSGIKMSHCKGCGICAKVCPKKAITMKEE